QHPNPKLALESTPFRLAHEGRAWAERPWPRRAGVSSFGIGGTNAHAILQEAPPQEPSGDAHPPYLLCLSAKTPEALERRTDDLAAHLESNAPASLADVAYTLAVGRKAHSYRRVLVCEDAGSAARALRVRDSESVVDAVVESRPPVAFVFPDAGAQYA